jgi:putative solute:sodium symporter small subunit
MSDTDKTAPPASPPAARPPAAPPPPGHLNARRRYWRTNLKVIFALLSVWAAVSYGCSILFIEQLNRVTIGRVPLGFWFAQQGSIYVFVVLIFVYAWIMDRLDRKYQVNE